jgi:hypothetical protein
MASKPVHTGRASQPQNESKFYFFIFLFFFLTFNEYRFENCIEMVLLTIVKRLTYFLMGL